MTPSNGPKASGIEAAADRMPLINVAVEGSMPKIEHRNTSEVTINFYVVDLELLFSKTPFVLFHVPRPF